MIEAPLTVPLLSLPLSSLALPLNGYQATNPSVGTWSGRSEVQGSTVTVTSSVKSLDDSETATLTVWLDAGERLMLEVVSPVDHRMEGVDVVDPEEKGRFELQEVPEVLPL